MDAKRNRHSLPALRIHEDRVLTGTAARQNGNVHQNNKAHSIGLRTCGRGNWTDKEIAILRENYASMRAKDIQKLLPGRNIESIHAKASQLGIHRQFQKQ